MTNLSERQRAHEAKFAMDEDTAFRVRARRNRLLGAWAAGLLDKFGDDSVAYSQHLVEIGVAGDTALIATLKNDLDGVVEGGVIDAQISALGNDALAQIKSETPA